MPDTNLSHRPHRTDRGQPFLGHLTLAHARLHEACGPARHTLAMMLAAAMQGPVYWVAPNWSPARLYGPGMARFTDPGRFTFIHAQRAEDILWTLEEVMRAGVIPLVIGDLPAPPGLTPVRRIHLAGETGAREGSLAPIGLILTPEGAASGVESRWHMAAAHGPGFEPEDDAWNLTRQRARNQPPRNWQVKRLQDTFILTPDQTYP